jgi:sterol desaturase/sphingolipid hydroxylase (fatty acid hydroxylase superfamily)
MANHPFFERYKINDNPWPWQEDKENWHKLRRRSLLITALNNFIVMPIALTAIAWSKNWEIDLSFREEDLPDSKKLIATVFFCMMCEDLAFYFCHKLLHWRVIYPYIHKIHHENITTYNFAAEHTHPLEFIFGNILPSGLGSLILG